VLNIIFHCNRKT